MGYRDDIIALTARRDALRAELAGKDAVALADSLLEVETRLQRRRLRVLSSLRIATPCDARWEAMEGEGRARHCGACDRTVYDVRGLTAAQALQLIGEGACMRLYRRRDGTVITADCEVGRVRRRSRGAALAVGIAMCSALLAGEATDAEVRRAPTQDRPAGIMMGQLTEPAAREPTVAERLAEDPLRAELPVGPAGAARLER